MRTPHFVNEYETFTRDLIANQPLDVAMARAVGGGNPDIAGRVELAVLQGCGLTKDMTFLDFGCGSGRLAKQVGIEYPRMVYTGIDVVSDLLDYAKTLCPPHFRFVLNHALSIPCKTESLDMIAAFSVFTHLFHEESFIYLRDIARVLRPGGSFVFSFLEAASNWPAFERMITIRLRGRTEPLDMFIERSQIEDWAGRLGFDVVGYDFGPPHDGHGQTVTMLRKRLT